jgi:hypothetical protein
VPEKAHLALPNENKSDVAEATSSRSNSKNLLFKKGGKKKLGGSKKENDASPSPSQAGEDEQTSSLSVPKSPLQKIKK